MLFFSHSLIGMVPCQTLKYKKKLLMALKTAFNFFMSRARKSLLKRVSSKIYSYLNELVCYEQQKI